MRALHAWNVIREIKNDSSVFVENKSFIKMASNGKFIGAGMKIIWNSADLLTCKCVHATDYFISI